MIQNGELDKWEAERARVRVTSLHYFIALRQIRNEKRCKDTRILYLIKPLLNINWEGCAQPFRLPSGLLNKTNQPDAADMSML